MRLLLLLALSVTRCSAGATDCGGTQPTTAVWEWVTFQSLSIPLEVLPGAQFTISGQHTGHCNTPCPGCVKQTFMSFTTDSGCPSSGGGACCFSTRYTYQLQCHSSNICSYYSFSRNFVAPSTPGCYGILVHTEWDYCTLTCPSTNGGYIAYISVGSSSPPSEPPPAPAQPPPFPIRPERSSYAPWAFDDSISTNGELTSSGRFAFSSAVLVHDKVVFTPMRAREVCIYDVSTHTFDRAISVATSLSSDDFLYGHGVRVGFKVVFPPFGTGVVGVYDASTGGFDDSIVTTGATGLLQAFHGAAAVDDLAVFTPYDADIVGLFNVTSNTFRSVSTGLTGSHKWVRPGIVVGSKVIFTPYSSNYVGVYDARTNTFDYSVASTAASAAFMGAIVVGSKVVFTPYSANVVGVYDVDADQYTSVPTGSITTSAKFAGSAAVHDKVVFAPSNADQVGVYDVSTNTFSTYGSTGLGVGGPAYEGAVAVGVRVLFAPMNADNVGVLNLKNNSFSTISIGALSTSQYLFSFVTHAGDRLVFAPDSASTVGILYLPTPPVSACTCSMVPPAPPALPPAPPRAPLPASPAPLWMSPSGVTDWAGSPCAGHLTATVDKLVDDDMSTGWNAHGCFQNNYHVIFDMGKFVNATGFRMYTAVSSHSPASVSWYACSSTNLVGSNLPGDCNLFGTFARDPSFIGWQEHETVFTVESRFFALTYPGWGPNGNYQSYVDEISVLVPF